MVDDKSTLFLFSSLIILCFRAWLASFPPSLSIPAAQMNNATLHALVLAVKAHQRQERRQALASGAELPDSLFAFTPKTKKEMSRRIRSIQGRSILCCVFSFLCQRRMYVQVHRCVHARFSWTSKTRALVGA